MLKLYATVGIPGSGKSTIAQQLVTDELADIVIETDALRLALFGDMRDMRAGRLIHEGAHMLASLALEEGMSPVLDATNLRPEYRAPVLRIARAFDAAPIAIRVPADLDDCLVRNSARPEPIPDDVIRRMAPQFDEQCTVGQLVTEGWSVATAGDGPMTVHFAEPLR